MAKTGKHNTLTDVAGILVGNYTDIEAVSGVTVVVCPMGAVAGVDVRGSAPGTRETTRSSGDCVVGSAPDRWSAAVRRSS